VEPPVVCRPTDKQRRYCKCIGTTRCGASLAAFLRDASRRARTLRTLFTRSIVRSLADRFYRIASRERERLKGETIVTYERCTSRIDVYFPLSFSFSLRLTRRRPTSFMRSRAPSCPPSAVHPFFTPAATRSPTLPFTLGGMMDLHGGQRGIENNKVGHAIQARMQRNYTPISPFSRARSYVHVKYLFGIM